MTILEFTLAIVSKLTWPVLIIIALLLLRTPLLGLIPKIRSVKYKDFEMAIGQDLRSAAEQAEDAFNKPKNATKNGLILKASHFPNEALLQAWSEVSDTAEKLVLTLRPELQRSSSEPYKALEIALNDDDLLTTRQLKLFTELRQLRNKVAHAQGFSVGSSDALLYIELCFQMVETLKQALMKETIVS